MFRFGLNRFGHVPALRGFGLLVTVSVSFHPAIKSTLKEYPLGSKASTHRLTLRGHTRCWQDGLAVRRHRSGGTMLQVLLLPAGDSTCAIGTTSPGHNPAIKSTLKECHMGSKVYTDRLTLKGSYPVLTVRSCCPQTSFRWNDATAFALTSRRFY